MADARDGSVLRDGGALYTPASMQQASRIVTLIAQRYPRVAGETCRTAVARMYGHADWPALAHAVGAGCASRDDEDETDEIVAARALQQRDAALNVLGGMDEAAAVHAARLARDLLASTGASIGARYDPAQLRKRVDRARYAYAPLYAAHSVLEVRPSARDRRCLSHAEDGVRLAHRADLLPAALFAWLKHHRPLLAAKNRDIGDCVVNRHAATSLMRFAFRWGELSVLHAAALPQPLQIYPVVLCALRAAQLSDERGITCAGRALGLAEPADRETGFILAQPREDYRLLSPSAREQQLNAGYVLLKRHLEEAAARPSAADFCARTSLRSGGAMASAA
jgi:hypothetical protein